VGVLGAAHNVEHLLLVRMPGHMVVRVVLVKKVLPVTLSVVVLATLLALPHRVG